MDDKVEHIETVVPGQIIEYKGKKYYGKRWVPGYPVCFDLCALSRQCTKFNNVYRCADNTYLVTIKQAIAQEKKKIKNSEKLIKILSAAL